MGPLQKPSGTTSEGHFGTISARQIAEICSCFSIGDRIQYYPEYQANLTMQSLVLGYQIDGHTIFSRNNLKIQANEQGPGRVQIEEDGQDIELRKIESFAILLPGNAGEEYKLNFLSKASLGSRGQFRNGNAITLISRFHDKGVIEIESSVRESFIPKDGYYLNHRIVVLEVITSSLKISEQRTHHRLRTNIAAKLLHEPSQTSHDCIMGNYSEVSAQLKLGQLELDDQPFKKGDPVTLTIKIDQLHRTFTIRGSIMRNNPRTLIITLQELKTGGSFKPIELIDALDIKASLLQHQDSH